MKKLKKGASISAWCHTKDVVKLIKDSLKGETLEDFNKSCFGPLLNLAYGEVNFQLQLLFHAMLNLSESKRDFGVPVFNFNNTVMEFSRRDFFLVTGLKFGPNKEIPVKSDLHDEVFKGRELIKFGEIKKEFTKACTLNKGKGEVCLKLALLVFLYGVLLSRDNSIKTLDTRYLHLADNVQLFNEHPWGLVAYNYLCKSLFKAYDLMMPKLKARPAEKPAFDVCGFLFALQCWFYEIMPAIGNEMGEQVLNWYVTFPRVLRWKSIGVQRFVKVKKWLEDPELVVQPIEISLTEKISLLPIGVFLNDEKIESFSSHRGEELSRPKSVKRKISYPNGEDLTPKAMKRQYMLRCRVKRENGHEDDVPSDEGRDFGPSINTHCDCEEGKLVRALQKTVFGRFEKIECTTSQMNENIIEFMAFMRKFVQSCPGNTPATNKTQLETPGGKSKSTPGPGAVEEAQNSPGEFQQKDLSDEKDESKRPKSVSAGDDMNPQDKTDYDGDDSASFAVEGFAENLLVDCPIEVATDIPFGTPPSTAVEWNSVLFQNPRSHDQIPHAPLRSRPNTRSNPLILTSSSSADVSMEGDKVISNNEDRMETVPEAEVEAEVEAQGEGEPVAEVEAQDVEVVAAGDKVRPMYDPMKNSTPHLFSEFDEWYRFARRTGSSIRLRVHWPETAGYRFFYPIFMKYQQLSTLQTDAILFLLLIKQKQKPSQFLSNWTVMEQQCWVKFERGIMTESTKKALLQFVSGVLPEQGGKPWSEVDHVYGVAHVMKDHFVAYDVQLAEQRIVVYDSMSMSRFRENMLSEFDYMSRLIPELIGYANVSRHSGPLKARWPVILHRHPPQQHNGRDCGIYAVKFIECLAAGRSVDHLQGNIGPSARNTYCTEFYQSRILTEN